MAPSIDWKNYRRPSSLGQQCSEKSLASSKVLQRVDFNGDGVEDIFVAESCSHANIGVGIPGIAFQMSHTGGGMKYLPYMERGEDGGVFYTGRDTGFRVHAGEQVFTPGDLVLLPGQKLAKIDWIEFRVGPDYQLLDISARLFGCNEQTLYMPIGRLTFLAHSDPLQPLQCQY